ncbi:MAG: twin transmembrane helix small protein [Alphaproteobacteria bacterium]|nr:twin transmembrane helix small protein [Alphaproteobacteria bacterium]
MSAILPYLVYVAMGATVIVLIVGVLSMLKGGEINQKYGNKLMRARILFQLAAVLLLGALFLVGR